MDVRTFMGHQFFGDSMLARLGRHIEESRGVVVEHRKNSKGRDIYYACTGGATVAVLKKRLINNQSLFVGVPTLLLVGTNDILHGTRFDRLMRDVIFVLRNLQGRRSRVTVMLLPPIPRLHPRSRAEAMRKAYNEKLRIYAAKFRIKIVDIQHLFLWADGSIKMHLFERLMGANQRMDLIHWNKAGMDLVIHMLRQRLV